MKTSCFAFILIVCFTVLAPPPALAVRPMGITISGVVRSVDHGTRQIVFAQDGGSVKHFVYSEWAKFWHDSSDSSPAALKAGMRVRVNLRNPLFGPDYVTQITLLPFEPLQRNHHEN